MAKSILCNSDETGLAFYKILDFVCLMTNLLLYFSKKNPSVYPVYVFFINNIQLWFTTWLTNTTFYNGGMHNVQHSQAMLERGVCELAHFFFHFNLMWNVCLCNTDVNLFSPSSSHSINQDLCQLSNILKPTNVLSCNEGKPKCIAKTKHHCSMHSKNVLLCHLWNVLPFETLSA